MLRSRTFTTLAATALLGSLALFTPATTASAEPTPTVVKTLLTDVTGDGRNDKVELIALGSNRYRLTVTPAKSSKTSSVQFTSELSDRLDAADVLYGAAAIDGAKGMELIVNLWADSPNSASDNRSLSVYTWRSGALVSAKAPKATWKSGWFFGYSQTRTQGYRFFDSHGRRYVDVSDLSFKASNRWVGKITRSVWRKGHWVKVSSRSVRLTEAQAQPYLRYDGPYLLKSIINADIDGDSRADELRYYLYRDVVEGGKYRLKVTTATKRVVTKKWASVEVDPLVGVAELDGAAGAEVILLENSDRRQWRVLTWRGGKLVTEKSPAACGFAGGGTTWGACDDYASIQWVFSTEGGARFVDFQTTEASPGEPGTLRVDRSVWQTGTWVKVSSSTQPIAADWWDTKPSGLFAGVTLLEP